MRVSGSDCLDLRCAETAQLAGHRFCLSSRLRPRLRFGDQARFCDGAMLAADEQAHPARRQESSRNGRLAAARWSPAPLWKCGSADPASFAGRASRPGRVASRPCAASGALAAYPTAATPDPTAEARIPRKAGPPPTLESRRTGSKVLARALPTRIAVRSGLRRSRRRVLGRRDRATSPQRGAPPTSEVAYNRRCIQRELM